MIEARHIAIGNRVDAYQVAASVFEEASKPVRGCVVIVSAMAIARRFYDGFGRWLAAEGLACVTFDCRGMFDSPALNPGVNANDAALVDWGRLDLEGVTQWGMQTYPGVPLFAIGHSMGGHLLGLAPSAGRFERIMLVGSGSVYWGWNSTRASRALRAFLWHALVPSLTALLGAFPGRRLGIVGNLPGRVATDWARWCRNPDYVRGAEPGACAFDAVRAGVLSVFFEGDPIIPESAVRALGAYFTSAQVEYLRIEREALPPNCNGHFEIFQRRVAGHVWPALLRWLMREQASEACSQPSSVEVRVAGGSA